METTVWVHQASPTDEKRPEKAARRLAFMEAGVFLRDYYNWLCAEASGPDSWLSMPEWAERIPLDVSFVLRQLNGGMDDRTFIEVRKVATNLTFMLEELDSPPDPSRLQKAVESYAKTRRDNA